jgi:hypothetical protein
MRRYYSAHLKVKGFEEWTGFGNSQDSNKANSRNNILNVFQIMDNA